MAVGSHFDGVGESQDHGFTQRARAWMEAVQRKDRTALEGILAPDYTYTASGQGRWSRPQWLDAVATYDIHDFAFREVDVRRYGEVAVVLSRCWQAGAVDGVPRNGEFLITDVWVRRNDTWQVVARSSILLSQAAP